MGCGGSKVSSAYVFEPYTTGAAGHALQDAIKARAHEGERPFDDGTQRPSRNRPTKRRHSAENRNMTGAAGSYGAEGNKLPARAHKYSVTDFELGVVVGRGGFSRVHLAKRLKDNKYFALKMVNKRGLKSPALVEDLRGEKFCLAACFHPFIVDALGTFQDKRYVYFLQEFVPGGELFSRAHKVKRMAEQEVKFYVAELTCALHYLHGSGIIYRDLKPENVMIDNLGHLRLVDLGFARRLKGSRCKGRVGTPHYLAPEMLHKSVDTAGYTVGVDWWALGCLMYELLAGKAAFGSARDSTFEVYTRVMQNKLRMPGGLSAPCKSLLKALLTTDPTKRLSDGADVKAHQFFAGVDWNAVEGKKFRPPWMPELDSLHDTRFFDPYSVSAEAGPPKLSGEVASLLAEF